MQRLQWRTRKREVETDAAFDFAATQKATLLRKMVHEAAASWQQKHNELEEAEASALLAREEVDEVRRNGASLGRAAEAGALLFDRLASKVRRSDSSLIRSDSSFRSGAKKARRHKSTDVQRAHSCRM